MTDNLFLQCYDFFVRFSMLWTVCIAAVWPGQWWSNEFVHVIGVWNSSKHTVQDIIPVFLLLSLLKNRAKWRSSEQGLMWNWKLMLGLRLFSLLHFYVACLLVVAEWARELSIQISGHLLLWRRLSFGLSTTHCTQAKSIICLSKKMKQF